MTNPILPGLDIQAGTIFCIGRNYAKHAAEMGANIPKQPVVFLKPVSAICFDGDRVHLPTQSSEVHYEGEIVIAIGKSGKNIPESEASSYIAGIGCGIDLTARDLQKEAKQNGLPWSVAKGFDRFAPISSFIPFKNQSLGELEIRLSVNSEIRQQEISSTMIFSIPSLISYLSSIFTLNPGDLVFTGTPDGVGAIHSGDIITSEIPDLGCSVTVSITR